MPDAQLGHRTLLRWRGVHRFGAAGDHVLTIRVTALDDAVSLPVLRPLIGHDKTEITREARQIATLALSEVPGQDCCTLLTPRQAETQARSGFRYRREARLDARALAVELAARAQEYRPGHP